MSNCAVVTKLSHSILYVICWYSFMLNPKMFAQCPNPSTMWAILRVINAWFHYCKFMCDMQYLICWMFSFICSLSWCIYDIPILLCSISEFIYFVFNSLFACFNSFITWAIIALSAAIFVASSLLPCIGNSCISNCIALQSAFMLKIICGIGRFTFWPLVIVTI